jgi:DNA-binding response OmpR family regulator
MSTAPILVVDDDPKIVTLVRTYLEREGFTVITAGDGKSALAAVAALSPRLIVLDIMLPELDGLALMRILRERSEIPIVLLSARGCRRPASPMAASTSGLVTTSNSRRARYRPGYLPSP